MRRKRTATASAIALAAAAAALTGSAAAQDQAATDGPGSAASPAPVTTPSSGSQPSAAPDGTTDLGTLEIEVTKPPPTAATEGEAQRRAGAKNFLAEERRAAKTPAGTTADAPTDPFGDLLAAPTIGVPSIVLESFRIPPFLLPIYQAAGVEYGVRWEVLAAINEVETDYGRNLSVSSAGALGWMQFMPATWRTYGVDANADGHKDPYNPVDAIFAAARYLRASGAATDLERAIFAYNHSDAYVQDVLARARSLAALPQDVIGALTGLTLGRFPVAGRDVNYPGRFDAARGGASAQSASTTSRRGTSVTAPTRAAVIAVQDGRVIRIGRSKRLGTFMRVRDVYGNTYTYGNLRSISKLHVVPKDTPSSASAASAPQEAQAPSSAPAVKERLFANPQRKAALQAGGRRQIAATAGSEQAIAVSDVDLGRYLAQPYALRVSQVALMPLREGSRVIAGTVLGQAGASRTAGRSRLRFEIRPAGSDAPRIDPTPILDGWRLLDSTQLLRAASPTLGGETATIGQILLMSKEVLERRVLANPGIEIYECGRRDVRAGIVDRRVLATLEFLAASGLNPTVSSFQCGHGYLTADGNVSEHSSGDAVDISAINGTAITPATQGAGSIADITVRRLLTLQGALRPHQIITLMEYAGADNTLAMADHADHIHVGYRPRFGRNTQAGQDAAAILAPNQWSRLIGRLGAIPNPQVSLTPSRYALKVKVKVRTSGR
ncbi:unannotated protein [freshwater metagenome]|uniref:Unannotated protein n=1 Tax=freshwater metagenome TaxID=449393 RepID=A0A6J7D1C3_9ZZZZ|nr:transglycosylase SLT domain-containing protein [Actinomycetota bacterium]